MEALVSGGGWVSGLLSEKKIHALYDLLEDEIEESILWWQDKQFVKELDIRYKALERGNGKGYSISQTKEVISNSKNYQSPFRLPYFS